MFEGSTLALITTIGAKSKKRRTSPLAFMTIDDTPVVVASALGSDKNPGWYHNLIAHPVVTVEDGSDTYAAVAHVPTGNERDLIFDRVVALDSGFLEYQSSTSRTIPVVRLQRLPQGRWTRGLGDFLKDGHDWLRNKLEELVQQVEGESTTPASSQEAVESIVSSLDRRCDEFCASLTEHHTGEDNGAFVMIAKEYPGMKNTVQSLAVQHLSIKGKLPRLRENLLNLAVDTSDRSARMLFFAQFREELEQHFLYEERTIVPVLNSLAPDPTLQ